MAKKRNNPRVYICALVLFAGAVSCMIWSALQSEKVYFLNVSEALAMPLEDLQAARLFGTVAVEDLERADGNLGLSFILQDPDHPGQSVKVRYAGAIPDAFEPGAEVIVEGGMNDQGFLAKSLMTKCPSKYEKENRV